jgi:hypothetical protein
VAALLDEASARSRPGSTACWYAPDIVERIVNAKVRHDIGSHGGRHIYFGDVAAAEARDDLAFAADIHRAHRLDFSSFVYPRNAIGHLDVVTAAGLKVMRGPDVGWTRMADGAARPVRKAVNLADKMLPIPPHPALAQRRGGLVDIPGSMLLLARNGLRRFVLPAVTRAKLAMGLERARRSRGVFHLWFHPSNFYYRRDEQLATLAWFLAHAADQAARGLIEIRTMAEYAQAAAAPHEPRPRDRGRPEAYIPNRAASV